MPKNKKIFVAALAIVFVISFAFSSKGALINDLPSAQSLLERLLPFLKKDTATTPLPSVPSSNALLQQFLSPSPTPQSSQDMSAYAFAYENQIVNVVERVSPAVVSIILTKDVPVFEQIMTNPFGDFPGFQIQIPQLRQKGTQKKEIGGGSGFIISSDGLILTNRHVVEENDVEYTVVTNDGKKYNATVLARDPSEDLAIIKITAVNLPAVTLGDSSKIKIGQTAIAIGNALGEFRNTVSVGVVSGLSRSVEASGSQAGTELLENVIQTDAAINKGNSGGPLLNLRGDVIGINSATVLGAQSIGFAIPIDRAKTDIQSVLKNGRLVLPFLGVHYVLITPALRTQLNLSSDFGALISKDENSNESAIVQNSPAAQAGLKDGDIILRVNGENITAQNSLSQILRKYKPGDTVILNISRDGREVTVGVILAEMK